MDAIRLIKLGQTPSWQTQAYYHAVAELMDESKPDTIILCQPTTPYLCLGYHQRLESIFDRAVCDQLGIPIYRRRVGGGGTYLDADQLFYQSIFHHSRAPKFAEELYASMLAAPVATLKRLGLSAELRAVNEIEVQGRRIAGIGGGRIREASVVVGNFLFDFDFETMTQVWASPWEQFRRLASTALYDRITTVKSHLPDIEMGNVEEILIEEYEEALQRPLSIGTLTDQELELGNQIHARMCSQEYLYMHDDAVVIGAQQGLKIAAGVFVHALETTIMDQAVQATFLVKDGLIQSVHIEADQDFTDLETSLCGLQFDGWQEALLVVQ